MNRIVPHQTAFDKAKKYDYWQSVALYISTFAALSIFILNLIQKSNSGFKLSCLIDISTILVSLSSSAFLVLDLITNGVFYEGGKQKRIDLIDNSFGSNYSGQASTGYFNSQGVQSGIYKLGVHGFENSLFTSTVAKEMAAQKWRITIILSSILFLSVCFGNRELINSLLQLALFGTMYQQAIRLQQFSNRMSEVHSDFKLLFNSLKNIPDKESMKAEIIKNVLNYEAIHAWGCILMDSKIFNNVNTELSQKWEGMKRDYNI